MIMLVKRPPLRISDISVVEEPARNRLSGVEAQLSAVASLNTPAPTPGLNCTMDSVWPFDLSVFTERVA